jgi:RNA polymerase sigma factor (sigma-70 family)
MTAPASTSPRRHPGSARRIKASRSRPAPPAEEYRRCQPALELYLANQFPWLDRDTREDICQEAWSRLVELRRNGSPRSGSPLPFLKKAARGKVCDMLRSPSSGVRPSDPLGAMFAELRAEEAGPAEAAEGALSDAELRGVLEKLSAEEQAVVKLGIVWGWSRGDVQGQLRITRRRYERLRGRALRKVAEALQRSSSVAWAEARGRLISRIVAGSATAAQLIEARKLAARDPGLRSVLASYEQTVHSLGLAIPAEVALRTRGGSLLHQGAYLAERARDATLAAVGRGGGSEPVEATVAQATQGGSARGAGAAGAGVLAKIAGAGAVPKVVATCLAGGATTAACVAAGVVPEVRLPGTGGGEKPAVEKEADQPNDIGPSQPADILPPQVGNEGPPPDSGESVPPPPPPEPEPAPPPAPPVEQEFGVAPTPSSGTSTTRDGSSGGGSSGGDSAAAEEFAP